MEARLEDFIRLSYSIRVVPELSTEGLLCYMAYHPELPGCMSHGDTPEEAIANLSEAKKLYIKILIKKGQNVPLPTSSSKAIWEITELEAEAHKESLCLVPTKVNPIESLELNKEEIVNT